MIEENVHFYSDTFKLEGVLSYDDSLDVDSENSLDPESKTSKKRQHFVLLCSPHPNLGGDMENNVILALAESLVKCGYVVLRFNYRGVGESESNLADIAQKYEYWEKTMDSEDYGDFVTDSQTALNFLKKMITKGDSDKSEFLPLFVVGYSFGAVLSLRILFANKPVKAAACVSLPFGKYSLQFTHSLIKPKYFICSDNDFAASIEEAEQEFKQIAEKKSMELITDCDHFYRGNENLISDKVVSYLNSLITMD